MNKFTFDSSWKQIKGKLRQKYAELTDDDLQFAEGKGEEFLGHLQERLSVSATQLHKLLNGLKEEVEEAAGTVQGKFEAVKHKVAEVAHDVKAKVTEAAKDLKEGAVEKAEELYHDTCDKVRSWHEEAEDYVRKQPRTVLLGALAAGFMLGLLVKR